MIPRALVVAAGLAVVPCACTRRSDAASGATRPEGVGAATPTGECGHAVCGDDFFIDVPPSQGCDKGATCAMVVRLVATGEFHVNDDYPYRFRADDTADVQFAGIDAAGKNVFSKVAGDWRKTDAKSGVMTVKFVPTGPGPKTVAGTLKLSVCSGANCLLEQRHVSAAVLMK